MAELLGNGGAGAALLLLVVEAKEVKNWTVNRSGRRVGGSCRGQQRQDGHGAWQHSQVAGDECHPRGARFLNSVRYCSSPFS